MNDFLHEFSIHVRETLGYVALALAGGVLWALKRGTTGVRAWVAALLRACVVGVLASRVITATEWDQGWQWIAVAWVAFGADAILILADAFWTWAARNPSGVGRALYEWLVNRRVIIERRPPGGPPGPTGEP